MDVPEFVWVGGAACLVFTVVYALARRGQSAPMQPRPATHSASISHMTVNAPLTTSAAASMPSAPDSEPSSLVRATALGHPGEAPRGLPKIAFEEEDENVDPTKVGALPGNEPVQKTATHSILHDEDATVDEPTQPQALILVTGMAQTNRGRRRKRNEDSILAMPEIGVYAVADGMGGYHGGDIASALAAQRIEEAFRANRFDGPAHDWLPRRASELARAIQAANTAILKRAEADKDLEGMGTTVCAARFSPNKQRLYIGHVGDSRMYRMRGTKLEQLTKDHVMEDLGVTGATAGHLSRAVGIWPVVPVDVVLCKPRPRDLYLLCSDGLTKMVDDKTIQQTLAKKITPQQMVDDLINEANARGGNDNISVIVIRVDPAVPDVV